MDESRFIYQWEMSFLDQFTSQQEAHSLGEIFQQSLSPESYTPHHSFHHLEESAATAAQAGNHPKPRKIQKISSWNSCTTDQNSIVATEAAHPNSLPFCHSNSPNGTAFARSSKTKEEMGGLVSLGSQQNSGTFTRQGSKKAAIGAVTTNAQDHIIAERKRREKLSERFIALSALIPGLKKTDKASVLGDAVKYVKELRERVNMLEEQNAKRTVETVVLVRKPQLSTEDDASSTDENFDGQTSAGKPLPEIEARLSNKTLLLRVHCESHKGILVKVLSEIEKLHLTVTNANAMPFLDSSINITLTAQIEKEFTMTLQDLVRKLTIALS